MEPHGGTATAPGPSPFNPTNIAKEHLTMPYLIDSNGNTPDMLDKRRAGGFHNDGPVRVYAHSYDVPHIIQLVDGRFVAADHEGRPIVDRKGAMLPFNNPANLSPADRAEVVQDIRNGDPRNSTRSETHAAPSPEDTAAIRDYLAAKYGANVAGPEGQAAHL